MSFRLVGVYVTTGCDFFSGCQPADRIVDVTGPRGNVVTVALSTFQCWINKSMNNRLKIRIDKDILRISFFVLTNTINRTLFRRAFDLVEMQIFHEIRVIHRGRQVGR